MSKLLQDNYKHKKDRLALETRLYRAYREVRSG